MIIKTLPRKWNLHRKDLFSFIALSIFALPIVFAQDTAIHIDAPSPEIAKAPVPSYDAITIKPDKSGNHGIIRRDDGATLVGYKLREIIRTEYDLADSQILGAPAWVNSDPYEVTYKADSDVANYLRKLNPDDSNYMKKRMMQAVLADRFQFKYHREVKELPIYVLTLAKGGSKLQEPKPGETLPEGFKNRRGLLSMLPPGSMTGKLVPIPRLVLNLSWLLGRPVMDKTGLTGIYDFAMKWDPSDTTVVGIGGQQGNLGAAPESSEPSFFTAIQEQLGLKLTSQKGPTQAMVIDHVERPSEN